MRRQNAWIILLLLANSLVAAEPPPAQVEFTSPTNLLSPQGALEAWGWAKHAHMVYNRDAIPADRLDRVKEWEHYTVMSPDFTIGVTMAQIGGLTLGSVEIIDYKTKERKSAMFLASHPKEKSLFPPTPYGNTELRGKESFVSFKFDEGRRLISFNFPKTPTAPAFAGDLELANKSADERTALARPFDQPGQYFYENKIFGMPARGQIKVNDTSYSLPDGKSFAIFDWGRGIWPRKSQWFWGQAAGKIDGEIVAINLGNGYGDDSRGTANAILVGGKLHKLRDVKIDYDPQDRMRPWTFTSDDGRLDLKFRPIFHQDDKQQMLIASTELHKIHGYFSGKLVLGGQPIQVDGLLGFAEHMAQRW